MNTPPRSPPPTAPPILLSDLLPRATSQVKGTGQRPRVIFGIVPPPPPPAAGPVPRQH